MLTIVASMQRELSALDRALIRNLGSGHGQELRVIGIGPGRAAEAVTALLASPSAAGRRAVLLLGFAGALKPELKTGGLILASAYHRQPATATQTMISDHLTPDPEMARLAVKAAEIAGLPVNRGPSLTVDALVPGPARKRRLHQSFAVTSVNMEDHAVAAVCAQAGAAFLSARAVLDTAEQSLPGYLTSLSDSGLNAAVATLLRPWRLPVLLPLAGRARRAQTTLCGFGLAFVQRFVAFGNLPETASGDQTRGKSQVSLPSSQEPSGAIRA